MKTKNLFIIAAATIAFVPATTLAGKPFKKLKKRTNGIEKRAEKNALREEIKLDKKDTHGSQRDPGLKDSRPADIHRYVSHTYSRIVSLLKAGAVTEQEGQELKQQHTDVVTSLKANKESGGLSDLEKSAARKSLDILNDNINASIEEAEKGDDRTPLLNIKQHRYEETIEAGERRGRLSKGEASSLRRKLESLYRLEDRIKHGKLSVRDREKLHKEALELQRDIHKELRD